MGQGIIQAKLLGGLGNQMHQYAACRSYARYVGARFECHPWVGQEIFELTDPPWSCELREVNDGGSGTPPEAKPYETNIRIGGYFQHQRWVGIMNRHLLRTWFSVQQRWLDLVSKPHGWYVAAHLRRGDYVNHPCYATVSKASYERAILERGYDPEQVVWVSDDVPRWDDGIPASMSFLVDWLTLLRADVIFRANSTFSWWASALSDAKVYSPVVEDRTGECDVEFVEGNWPRCADTSKTGVKVEDLFLAEN